jgi:hypothetical protein
MRTLIILLCFLALLNDSVQAQKTRAEFAQAMAKVKEGLPSEEVAKILGKPDDIVTSADFGGSFDNAETWGYGTSEHWDFPPWDRF